MELKEIKAKIADLRYAIEELADECDTLWRETDNTATESVANYLYYELQDVAHKLSDLEDTEAVDGEETDTEREARESLDDWWDEQDTMQKCRLANVPYPTEEDGRGENLMEAEDRADKWWKTRTLVQKQEVHEENTAWWDNE